MIKSILQTIARLPISLKGWLPLRLGSKLSSFLPIAEQSDYITSNLGVNNRFRMRLPIDKSSLVFGTPKHYSGERGVLFLSQILARSVNAVADIGANWGYFTYFLKNGLSKDIPIYFF